VAQRFSFFFAVLIFSQSSLAQFEARLRYRNSTFCGSILATVRAHHQIGVEQNAIDEFHNFREQILKTKIDLSWEKQRALTASASSFSAKKLGRRVYGIERTFQSSKGEAQRVIGQMKIQGVDEIETFLATLDAAEQRTVELKKRIATRMAHAGITSGRFDHSYDGFYATAAGFATPIIFALIAEVALKGHIGIALSYGAIAAAGGATGFFDLPVRYLSTYQFANQKLRNSIRQFLESNEDWSYWSKDVFVSQFFGAEIEKNLSVYSMVFEDLDEMVLGLRRLVRNRERERTEEFPQKFSVDVLMKRSSAGEPSLSLVIRSHKRMTKKKVSQSLGVPQITPSLQSQ
jgi:hypothetical protein